MWGGRGWNPTVPRTPSRIGPEEDMVGLIMLRQTVWEAVMGGGWGWCRWQRRSVVGLELHVKVNGKLAVLARLRQILAYTSRQSPAS